MLVSIITATHLKNSRLDDAYRSLCYQEQDPSHPFEWEWIIYLNGNARKEHLPHFILDDERIKVYSDPSSNTKIGYLKNQAFRCGSGDILVELDHDDMLTPDCLFELVKAFNENLKSGFVYSDCAVYHTKNEFTPYGAAYGWSSKNFHWKDRVKYVNALTEPMTGPSLEVFDNLISMNSFPPTSHSVAFVWYAPDHVRAWRRSTYISVGGHDPELDVCDDHDLVIRTYLATSMVHIPKTLYIYRVTGENTWLERNQAIQERTVQLYHKYAWMLAEKDAVDRGLLLVDIGGGINPRSGYLTIDLEEGAIKADLNDGIPLPDNSVGVLNASHIVEHLHDKHKIMCEIHRVLADGGWAFIEVPSTDGRGAFQDPTHVSYWNENSFWYYTRKDKAMYIRNDTIRFQPYRLDTIWWDDKIAITNAWLVAVKSDKNRPHLLQI